MMDMFSYILTYIFFTSLIRFDVDPLLNFGLFSGLIVFFYKYSEYEFFPIENFRSLPIHKKTYVVTNVVKSSFLLLLCGLSLNTLSYIALPQWNEEQIRYMKNLGALYSALDFTSIFYNQQMSQSTLLHHLCVLLFFGINYVDAYEKNSVCRLIMFYAMFSSASFYVNLVLGLRFILNVPPLAYALSFVAFLSSTCFNWSVQIISIMNVSYPKISLFLYLLSLSFIAVDDIILLRWLWRKSKLSN